MRALSWSEHLEECDRQGVGFGPWAEGGRVVAEPGDIMFWSAFNWPGFRAPARVEVRPVSEKPGGGLFADGSGRRWSASVAVWVPIDLDTLTCLEDEWTCWTSGDYSLARAWAYALRKAAELEAERDEHVRQLELLADAHSFGVCGFAES